MAPVSLGQIFSQRSNIEPQNVTNLKSTLTRLNFSAKVAEWARLTGAGKTYYQVGTTSDGTLQGATKAFVAVIIYCDKTPKVMTVPQWKAINTSNWEYQASSDLKIRIILKSDDRMKPDALVGSCVEAQSQNTDMDIIAPTRNGLLTLGLIIRHKDTTDPVDPANPLAGTSPWAVLVAHSFAHSKVLHTHSKNKLVACPLTLDGEQCTECLSEDCRNCGTVPNKVQLAIGKEIMRTRSNFANTTIPTLDVSVAQLPLPGTMKVQPLDVRGIKEFLTRAKIEDYEPGTLAAAREAFSKMDTASDLAQKELLLAHHLAGWPTYLFKRGAMTGWTWGLLEHADAWNFTIRNPALNPTATPISRSGDCGAIWFALEPISNGKYRARPVGCHYAGRAAEGDPLDVRRLAVGFQYYTAFEPEFAQGIIDATNWKPEDVGLEFEETYIPYTALN